MINHLAWNGLRRQPLMSLAAIFFIAASTALFTLTALLGCQLFGSIDQLMNQAQVPDVLQMYSGTVDKEKLASFANESEMVKDWQTSEFWNMDNAQIMLNGQALAGNTQDNGLVAQPEKFDFLLDLSGKQPEVNPGEVYVPIAYQSLYDLEPGDLMTVNGENLTIAGFIRDAQMNAMMCSSKRFLVHPATLEQLKGQAQEEALIEFMLNPGVSPSAFRQVYEEAGLPSSGPFIDRSLIRVMNALSDGTVIFILLLISLVILAISIVCIRYILSLQLEQDRQQTGMMKALGIHRKTIRRIYLVRYVFLAVPGILTGLVIALIVQHPMMQQFQKLYGSAPAGFTLPLVCLAAAIICGGIILLSVWLSLRKLNRQSPLDALQTKESSVKSTHLLSAAVCAGCAFLALLPLDLAYTLSSPSFVTNMGIGNAQLRLDLRPDNSALDIKTDLQNNPRIQDWVLLETYGETVQLADGTKISLPVETGNHQIFPVTLQEGHLPQAENELVLSVLAAKELDLKTGDPIQLDGQDEPFIVSGLYSDITNGGKTAKTIDLAAEDAPVWQVAYVTLKEGENVQDWMTKTATQGVSVTLIGDYVRQTYSQTLHQLDLASWLAVSAAVFITWVVLYLAIRLPVEQSRKTLSLKKALGFKSGQLKKEWFMKDALWCLAGTAGGLLLVTGPGQWICAIALDQMGAAGFHFEIPWLLNIGILLLVFMTALSAIWSGLSLIRQITPCECVKGKE